MKVELEPNEARALMRAAAPLFDNGPLIDGLAKLKRGLIAEHEPLPKLCVDATAYFERSQEQVDKATAGLAESLGRLSEAIGKAVE